MCDINEQLHQWAFSELCSNNEELAYRIIKVLSKRKSRILNLTWLEQQKQIESERSERDC